MEYRMSDLGEKRFISDLLRQLKVDPAFINGFGHDAGVIDLGLGDQFLAMNIDRVSRPIAAERHWTSYKMWGCLAVTVACSDLIAVGATPRGLMISITVPGSWLASDVRDIVSGCQEECGRNGVSFIGGDTKEGSSAQVVACSIGTVGASQYIGRTDAEPGCIALLAGTVGGFLGSYFQLIRCEEPDEGRMAEWIRYLSEPSAQWNLAGHVSRDAGIVAGMDLSDGLYEAIEVMLRGKLGFDLDLESLPYHPAALECSNALKVPVTNLAFGVGDWGILLAVKPGSADSVRNSLAAAGTRVSAIGRFTSSGEIIAHGNSGHRYSLRPFRNENFRQRIEDETDYMDQAFSGQVLIPISAS